MKPLRKVDEEVQIKVLGELEINLNLSVQQAQLTQYEFLVEKY